MLGPPNPHRLDVPIAASLAPPDPPCGRIAPDLELRLGDPVDHLSHQPPCFGSGATGNPTTRSASAAAVTPVYRGSFRS